MKYNYYYDPYDYPHPSVTVDSVVFGYDGTRLKVLLVERGKDSHVGEWALPGGFVGIKESAEDAIIRELEEETNLKIANDCIEQLHTYSAPNRDSRERVITIAYYTLVNISEVRGGDDATRAIWFPVDNVPHLAFDHNTIIEDALKALWKKVWFAPDTFKLLSEKSTLKQVRHFCGSVLNMNYNCRKIIIKDETHRS